MNVRQYFRPVPVDLPGFHAELAVKRMLNNPDLWWRTLTIFHDHYLDWESGWRAAQQVPEKERKCVHALRSSAANVGADGLAAAAAALENALVNVERSPQTLAALRASLLACLSEVWRSVDYALKLPLEYES